MRRSKDLVELSRRDFCGLACAGLVAACAPGSNPVSTGPLGASSGDDDDTGPADASATDGPTQPHPDGGTGPTPDAGSSGVACTSTSVDAGAASSYAVNSPMLISSAKMFVVKDAQGFYAVSAKCTHEGATMQVQGNYYYCPRHGARFNFDGSIISGPVTKSLQHYAMCDTTGGHVAVETSVTATTSQRLPG